jgi:hypothetical protein
MGFLLDARYRYITNKYFILPTEFIYGFRMILRINNGISLNIIN